MSPTQENAQPGTRHGLQQQAAAPGKDEQSKHARLIFANLMALAPSDRQEVYREHLSDRDWTAVLRAAQYETGTAYGMWADDPIGFTEDIIGETTWSKQKQVLGAIPNHKRTGVPSAFGTGKCLARTERVPLADGRMVEAGDLVGTAFDVLAWTTEGEQVRRPARADWNCLEPVIAVTTTGGRRVVRNAEHPLWVADAVSAIEGGRASGTVARTPRQRGWIPVGSIVPGDLVLVPESHQAQGTRPVERDHAILLGYLLGDGGTSDHQITFTQQDGDALDEFRAVCDRLDVDLVPKRDRPYCYRLRGRLRPDQHPDLRRRTNRVLDLVRQWGLDGKRAPEKALPGWAWTLPNDQLALVLSRLLACDGWAYVRETRGRLAAQVAIALASRDLIRDVEAAMLRLGISGVVRHRRIKYDGGHRDAWEWACTNRDDLIRLGEALDVPGKNHAIHRVVDAVTDRTARRRRWPHRNAPAGYRWETVTTVEHLPPVMTVSVEVEGEHTLVTNVVEHNTHLAARAALWRSLVFPPGTSLTITTATRFRQVQRQLWPHIRMAVAKAGLPMIADMTQLKAYNRDGVEVVVAYGFTAPPNDEAAMHGIHAPRLFIVVDEAGGISRTIGAAMRGLLTGDDTRLLAIGNPPTDDDNSWFEQFCDDEDVYVVPISAYDAPLQTEEKTPRCRACPPEVPAHRLAKHLVDGKWIEDTISDYGEDAPYVVSKVHAKFPKGGPTRAVPADWIDLAIEKPEPEPGPEWLALNSISDEERDEWLVRLGSWVRLGVDVAADGGDEFVIARQIGDLGTVEHTSSGSVNTNAVNVAGKVLEHIKRAERIRRALGTKAQVEVKIDAIGVGWGVASTLAAWASEGVHEAKIVKVVVSEGTYRDDEDATMRPYRKRDEMWLTGRALLQPRAETGTGQLRLRFDKRTAAQLSAPTYGTNSQGRTVIESKKRLRARGIPSPDRAEAWLMSIYQPINKDDAGAFGIIV